MATTNIHTQTDVHHHDDHEEEHGHGNFWTSYVFCQDHKVIAKQFLITGMAWALLGGIFSVIFRLQLGFPEASLAWLKPVLGGWITEQGKIDPEFYLALVTMHGTIMVFFVLTAGLSGTVSNFLIPLQVGARDMASGFMNMLSYWFFWMASVVMLSSLFVETGPASGGWTSYPPLSALGDASEGSKTGMDLWLVSMALFVVSSLLGGLNYISTILNMRTKGMSMTRLPLTIWALFFTAVLGVLSFRELFKARPEASIKDVMRTAEQYPRTTSASLRPGFLIFTPALANSGGGLKSIIQRPTRTPSLRHSVLVGVVASRGSPEMVARCRRATCV